MNPENIAISESISMSVSSSAAMSQTVALEANFSYQVVYRLTVVGSVAVQVATDYYRTVVNASTTITDTFVHGTGTGNYNLSFSTFPDTVSVSVEVVSLKQIESVAVSENLSVKEFLTGNTDEGQAVFFRADTQTLQIQPGAELYSNPIAVSTETERGSMVKTFVSLDDKQFYELQGTVTKGVSILKIHSNSTEKVSPSLVQSIQISYRDSSRQLCRILQAAVISTSTPIDYSP